MATSFASSIPAMIRASSGSARKPDPNTKKAASSSWWGPLFGMSSDPDYMNAGSSASRESVREKMEMSGSVLSPGRSGNRFAPGCFTEEKARQLRRKTAESSSFHDVMYHSAIASRLASDVSGRVDK